MSRRELPISREVSGLNADFIMLLLKRKIPGELSLVFNAPAPGLAAGGLSGEFDFRLK
jgi:hypothetical protein